MSDSSTDYTREHKAVKAACGSASDYPCVDCGKTAAHWAWIHGAPVSDVNSYAPRCAKCHAIYDAPRRVGKPAAGEPEPFLYDVPPILPIPLRGNPARTERVSSYMELDLVKFFEQYAARVGLRSTSEALRRLAIVGAMVEGYQFDGEVA